MSKVYYAVAFVADHDGMATLGALPFAFPTREAAEATLPAVDPAYVAASVGADEAYNGLMVTHQVVEIFGSDDPRPYHWYQLLAELDEQLSVTINPTPFWNAADAAAVAPSGIDQSSDYWPSMPFGFIVRDEEREDGVHLSAYAVPVLITLVD